MSSSLYAASDALAIIESLVNEFPGLLDGETEVNGSDLVESMARALSDSEYLQTYLKALNVLKG